MRRSSAGLRASGMMKRLKVNARIFKSNSSLTKDGLQMIQTGASMILTKSASMKKKKVIAKSWPNKWASILRTSTGAHTLL